MSSCCIRMACFNLERDVRLDTDEGLRLLLCGEGLQCVFRRVDSYRPTRNTTVNVLGSQSECLTVSGGVNRAAGLGRFES